MNSDYQNSLLYLGKRLKSFAVKQTDDGYVFTVKRNFFSSLFIYFADGIEVQVLPVKGGMRTHTFEHTALTAAHEYFCEECKRAALEETKKAPPDADKSFSHKKFAE